MNILAIDFGTKHMGLAWVGSGVDVVLPYGRIAHAQWKQELPQLIRDEKIDQVIVGIPYHAEDGAETDNSRRVRAFIGELERMISVPVTTVDERFTTKEAQLMDGDATLDEKAAMLMLQQYLSANRS